MRMTLALLCTALLISCGKADDTSGSSSLKLENTPPPSRDERTLDRVTFITAHNAFANDLKAVAPNQNLDISQQLEAGVRGLMLDIYSYNGKAVLCHPLCEIDTKSNVITKWFGKSDSVKVNLSRPLVDELRRIERFMNDHKSEIVTLHLEWGGGGQFVARANEFEDAFNQVSGLKNMIFDPYKANVKTNGWPKVKDMISQNKRLLILSQSDSTRHMGVGHDRDFVVENYWSMGTISKDRSCRSRWDDIPLDRDNTQANKFRRLFIMNHFRDIPLMAASALDDNNFGEIWGRVIDQCLSASRRIPNFLALDFATTGAGKDVVGRLNRAIGIGFEHPGWGGRPMLMMPGQEDLHGGQGRLDNDTLSSIEIFFRGTRVALFDNDNGVRFMKDIIDTTGDLGAENDRVSSWRVDN